MINNSFDDAKAYVSHFFNISHEIESQIHVIFDASERAYGAVLYKRDHNCDQNTAWFVGSKNQL